MALLRNLFETRLKNDLDHREIRAVFREIARRLWNFHSHDIFMKRNDVVTDESWSQAIEFLERLESGEPVQYITGSTEFSGLEIEVSPAALIPRPETEELVEEINRRFKGARDLRVLDIGTGTGCIALALKAKHPTWNIKGIDISKKAVALANRNANQLNLDVQFEICDIHYYSWSEPYDVLVSNPPYIAVEEKPNLQKQVIDHEPVEALFAPVNDVLYFYRLIIEKSRELLKPGGTLCFEIHYNHSAGVVSVLTENQFKNIEVKTDLSGNERMIFAVK